VTTVRRLAGTLAICTLAAVALSGCGLGAGSAPSGVQLTVTDGFGARLVGFWGTPRVRGQETVMSLLIGNARVGTSYGGQFVSSIDGLGGSSGEQPDGWFYFIDGVEGTKGAAAVNVASGERIWWDRHDWSQTESVPAVVGSFPAPFVGGIAGKRLPVRVECARAAGRACRTVVARLRALGVGATVATLANAGAGAGAEAQTLRVLVGAWSALEDAPGAAAIARGPRASGVYARFSAGGRSLALLGERGGVAQTLGAGSGLVAATRVGEDAPLWVVTGTSEGGAAAAAEAFDEADLHDRFALAIAPSGGTLGVPVSG
jgi:hypothetical protein